VVAQHRQDGVGLVAPVLGEVLIAVRQGGDLGRRGWPAAVRETEPGVHELRDVELELDACDVAEALLLQRGQLPLQHPAGVEGHALAVAVVEVREDPARPLDPREHGERGRVGHEHGVGQAGHPRVAEPVGGERRHGWVVGGVEDQRRGLEVLAVAQRGQEVPDLDGLPAQYPVLVAPTDPHLAQVELADPGGQLLRHRSLLLGPDAVPADEVHESSRWSGGLAS
jgi:hypothetical protein